MFFNNKSGRKHIVDRFLVREKTAVHTKVRGIILENAVTTLKIELVKKIKVKI